MDWQTIVPYLFGFMGLAIAGWVAQSIRDMSLFMEEMKDSVSELNVKIAVTMERDATRSDQVKDLDWRLTRLEDET